MKKSKTKSKTKITTNIGPNNKKSTNNKKRTNIAKKRLNEKLEPESRSRQPSDTQAFSSKATLSNAEARRWVLEAQGLGSTESNFGLGIQGTLRAIEHLSYVQIDTISVIERAHHHILQTRIPNYTSEFLHQLVTEKKQVFEYWSHAASYLPMSEFRFSLPRKRRFAEGLAHWYRPTAEHKRWRKIILTRLREEGALQSKDFERPANAKKGWFERTPAKQMLEQLFMEGELMISERRGFQKVYDLTERVLPAAIDTTFPTEEEMALYLIQTAFRSNALVKLNEICYARSPQMKNVVKKILKDLVDLGQVCEVKMDDSIYFANATQMQSALKNSERDSELVSSKKEKRMFFLSPFDGLVIQRKRLQEIFNFQYQIECYVPEEKRKFGYFSLPILYGLDFVGVVDLKAHREMGVLKVNRAFVRKNLAKVEHFQNSFQQTLRKFAEFNACDQVEMATKSIQYIEK